MKQKLKVLFAVLVIVGAAYWAFTAVWPTKYTGSKIMFPVGSGTVLVTNLGTEPIPIEMRSEGRTGTFRIESSDLGLAESAKRQGSGRDAYYTLSFDLPPGQARINVTRGSNVYLISRAETPIEAVVSPLAPGTRRAILIVCGLAIAWALYFISSVTRHRWLGNLRRKLPLGRLQPKKTAA
ncbi:hypothetical protein FKZ61_014935 [Litorilinea aerophila]|uniref:Uncharacterized protein n=1 Tax=Litorilinea aerophila TaxID=1204385 RepID=A0A540VDP0_9CHLR|nr:hypothetical protein [Litorilinea aerophila]MCC9077399.1 hypothetical protein [Litorilinea aerophila]OUC06936.1 hypothetical protein RY27_17950 [Litorilinea aerophila]